MLRSSPMPVIHHGETLSRLCPALDSASHVFLRVDAVKRPLTPPYEGPFPVLSRSAKTFKILRHGKDVTVSIDRLKAVTCDPTLPVTFDRPKPTVILPGSPTQSDPAPAPASPVSAPPPSGPSPTSPASPEPSPGVLDPESWPLPTRYGRRPRPPNRLNI